MDGGNLYGDDSGVREDDTFVAGQNTTIEDFDLSPDGAGLSGRSNQVNDIVFVQVTAASLAAAGYTLNEIYELVSGNEGPGSNQWRDFVRDLEVEVVDDTTTGNSYNEIRLSIDKDGDGQATDIGTISFLEAGTGSGNYNAVKMKTQLDEILAQFESTASDNAHVLEQFYGMDTLTASQLAALERAVEAGEDAQADGGDAAAVQSAIEAELAGEMFDQAQAVRDALVNQVSAAEMVAAAQGALADAVDEALAATDMDTSLFVPIAVEQIREGTVRTEVLEDRDAILHDIAAGLITREEALGKTTVVERGVPEAAQEAIVVLSNADDRVISTSGADDRFEVVPQVYVDADGAALSNQDAGRDVIVDLARRDDGSSSGGESSGTGYQVNQDALGDVVYLEGVTGIDGVDLSRFQVGREGNNSLQIQSTVRGVDENGNPSVDGNASEVTVFKQFDAMTDRFAVETLELSVNGASEYWSLSTTEAVRDGGRVVDTYQVADVSNTGKGILVGSSSDADQFVVSGASDGGTAEVKVYDFDASDSIDLTAFGDDLQTSVSGSDVEVSNANGDVVVKLIGLGDQGNIDDQLIGIASDT